MIISHVRWQYTFIIDNILDSNENLIVKVPLSLYGQGGSLIIVKHLDDNDGPDADADDDGNESNWHQNRRSNDSDQGMIVMFKNIVSEPGKAIMYKSPQN